MAQMKKGSLNCTKTTFKNVAGIRLELMTSGLWIQRSNQLSYPAIIGVFSFEKRLQKY